MVKKIHVHFTKASQFLLLQNYVLQIVEKDE